MKRIAFILCTMFICVDAWPETTDLKFVIDNETYTTQTCTVGGAVNLPPAPTKYGYDFDGWVPVFYRGTFATWNDIPTNASGYSVDSNGSFIPQENDYIIVNNASAVPEYGANIEIQVSTSKYNAYWDNYCRTYIDGVNYGCNQTIYDGNLRSFYYTDNYARIIYISDTKTIVRQGIKYKAGSQILNLIINVNSNGTYYAKFINSYPYSGKWLLRYHGNWDDYNRGGWVAEKQLD